MTWAEAREMSRHGITFGSHTHTHAILEGLDDVTMSRVATTLASRGTLKTHTFSAIEVDDFIAGLGSRLNGSR